MAGLGGLAGMGAAYGGYQEAEGADLQNRLRALAVQKGQYDFGAQSGADAALARAFPNILGGVPGVGGLGGVGQGPQGGPPSAPAAAAAPMPPAAAAPTSGPPPAPQIPSPMGGMRPGFPQTQQDLGDPSSRNRAMYGPLADAAGNLAAARGQPNMAAIPPPQPFAPPQRPAPPPQMSPQPPQQQPMQPQQPGMPGMGPQPGMMDWRGAFKSIIAANPAAQPGAIIGAMDKLVQLMNPIERAQWMEQRNMLTAMIGMGRLQQGQERIDERHREFDLNRQPTISGNALDVAAERYFKTGTFPPNMGRGIQGAANSEAVINRAAELHPDAPIEDWASQQQAFQARGAGLRTLETRVANLKLAAAESKRLIPRVQQLSNIVDRTEYPDINKIILAGERKTGDPNVIRLGIALKSARYVYARILKPVGVLNKNDLEEAQGVLQESWSKGQINAALQQMNIELESAEMGIGDVEQEYGVPQRFNTGGAGGTAGSGAKEDPLGIR